jgi:hypothetical protein
MSHVFISHVEEDGEIALEIARGLEEAGYNTWYFERDSLPGPSYLAQVGEAIERAKAIVLVISANSLSSSQVTNEVIRGYECNKPFIPVLRNIKHVEFQQRQPVWRQALAAATSINIPYEGVYAIIPGIVAGIKAVSTESEQKATPQAGEVARSLCSSKIQVETPYGYLMVANTREEPKELFKVYAQPVSQVAGNPNPHSQDIVLEFDIINLSKLEIRIIDIYVDVLKYYSVNVLEIHPLMSAGTTRRYFCDLSSTCDSYKCIQLSKGYDFIKLSSGELEHIGINVNTTIEGVYKLGASILYSLLGEQRRVKVGELEEAVGFFHRSKRNFQSINTLKCVCL